MMQYYKACTRELWFFAHQINMNFENDDISIGKLLHNKSYDRQKRNIVFGDVVFDLVRKQDDLFIVEIKKSSKLPEPALYQLYYYIFLAEKAGTKARGILAYPSERKSERVELTDEIRAELKRAESEIPEIVSSPYPPKAEKKRYCKHCTYYNLCWVK
jgi:CRISPR-associated exonuclease Cas4